MALLRSSCLSESHQSHICGLPPVPDYLYYSDLQNTPRSFVLHPVPVPTSHLYPLFCCNFPSKAISYFHSYFHASSSKLFIYFHFALRYTHFNLSLFFSVNTNTYLFCLFISSCQRLLPSSLLTPNRIFYLIILPQTLGFLSDSH